MDTITTYLASDAALRFLVGLLGLLVGFVGTRLLLELLRGLRRGSQLRKGGDPAPTTVLPDGPTPQPGATLNLPQHAQAVRRVRATSTSLSQQIEDHHRAKAAALGEVTLGRLAEQLASDGLDGWNALPGNRIELNTTGFWIELRPRAVHPFALYSPEHQMLANGTDLIGLKAFGEQHAAHRASFGDFGQEANQLINRLRNDR
jgi:hypothetical protein